MKRIHLIVFLFLLPLLAGCSFSLAGDVTPPPDYRPPSTEAVQPVANQRLHYPVAAPDPQKGAPIYTEKCAPCHGDQGLGDGPRAAQLPNPVAAIGSPEIARMSIPAEWERIVREGKMDRFMPFFDSLSDSQRWDVIAYVYSLSAPAEAIARGKELYQENCAGCHGESGKGDGTQASAASMSDFTDPAAMSGKSTASFFDAITSGIPPAMPGYADKLAEQDRWALAEYVRWLSFSSAGGPAAVAANPPASGTPGAAPQPQSTGVVTATNTLSGTQATGTVTGQILNGSGGEVPADLEVTLHGFDNTQLAISDTVTASPDGTFAFLGVAMPPGRSFLATTRLGQATYGSDVGTVQAGQDTVDLKITVFDTTTETSSLSTDRMHVFFDFSQPGKVQVLELYIISNKGNKMVVSAEENGPVLSFTLPNGAENLQFQDGVLGGRYLPAPGGFADTTPVRPGAGEYQVLFWFDMPYDRKLDLSLPVSLPVDSVVVLFPQDGVRVNGAGLQDDGTRDVQGATYHLYSGSAIKSGSALDLSLSGLPGGGSHLSPLGDRGSLVLGLGALGLVLVVVGLVLYRRGQNKQAEEEDELPEEEPGGDTPESLMDAIIALDDLYQEGRLPAEAYQTRRAELKDRLSQLPES